MSVERTWSAKIEVRQLGHVVTIDATPSQYDLKRDQSLEAVREAKAFIHPLREVAVIVYKTTKARGTERDRSFQVFRDKRGEVRYL